MKKWLVIFCLIVFPVLAQEISDNTFSENNPNLIRDHEPRTFDGGSLVYIQGISDKPQPKTWMDNVKIRLFGSMDIPNTSDIPHLTDQSSFQDPAQKEIGIPTKNFFGASKEIKYTAHTSSWDFIVQPMDSHTISVQENIQFLLTQETPIIRSWPFSKEEFALIKAKIDGRFIRLNKDSQQAQLDFNNLSAGLHTISLHYTLPLQSLDNFMLPLTDDQWPLITDTFSGVILNGKIGLNQPQFLLGENLQKIPENFIFQSDEQGNTFFKNNHILPAFTKIYLAAKITDIAPKQDENTPFIVSPTLIFIAALGIIFLYLLLCGLEIHYASLTYLLKKFKYTPYFLKCWFYRIGEVVIGCIILLILSFLVTLLSHLYLTWIHWVILIVSTVMGIVCLDAFIFYPKQKMIYQLHQNKGEK